jgi:hypothetical protein
MIVTGNGQRLQDLMARQGIMWTTAPCGARASAASAASRVSGDLSAPEAGERPTWTKRSSKRAGVWPACAACTARRGWSCPAAGPTRAS